MSTEVKPSIPASEVADLLRRGARGEVRFEAVGRSWNDIYCGNALFRADGWDLLIFNDCFELDYVDEATAPDGRTCGFDRWYDHGGDPVDLLGDDLAAVESMLEDAPVIEPELAPGHQKKGEG